MVVPTANDEPDGGVHVTFSGFTPPDTVGAYVSGIAWPSVEYAFSWGQVIVSGGVGAAGGGPVTTTTVLHDAVALSMSVAVHMTGVEPTGYGEAGEHVFV